jgi:hypothetical protein
VTVLVKWNENVAIALTVIGDLVPAAEILEMLLFVRPAPENIDHEFQEAAHLGEIVGTSR